MNSEQPTDPASKPTPEPKNRREFLATGVRGVLLGAMGIFTVEQLARTERLRDDPACIKLSTCADCLEFGGCVLPKSEEYRHDHGLPEQGAG